MKRNAGSDLNHDNWDKDEEKEERGQFATANTNVIAQRKLITARRKPATQTAGIFKSFSGFSNLSNTPSNTNLNFGTNHSENLDMNREKHLNSIKVLNQKFLESISKNIEENPICILTPLLDDYRNHLSIIKNKYPLQTSTNTKDNGSNLSNIEHGKEVIKNVPTFVVKPIDDKQSGPSHKELPVFKINETTDISKSNSNTKELFTFGAKEPLSFADNSKPNNVFGTNLNSFSFLDHKKPQLSFETPSLNKKDTDVKQPSTLSEKPEISKMFSLPSEKPVIFSEKPEGLKLFSLSSTKTDTKTEFSFPKSGNNLFGNGSTTSFIPQNTTKSEEDDVYEPPVAEVREVKETDSVYDTKCKLYFQKDKEWKERGAGNLFIKPYKTGQCQLVIRADNSLATIILNVMVNSSTPMNTNKNNVSIVTKTDFIEGTAPTILLIRVKTADKAEELLKALQTQIL